MSRDSIARAYSATSRSISAAAARSGFGVAPAAVAAVAGGTLGGGAAVGFDDVDARIGGALTGGATSGGTTARALSVRERSAGVIRPGAGALATCASAAPFGVGRDDAPASRGRGCVTGVDVGARDPRVPDGALVVAVSRRGTATSLAGGPASSGTPIVRGESRAATVGGAAGWERERAATTSAPIEIATPSPATPMSAGIPPQGRERDVRAVGMR
jgi:hypothetical protein